jgi:FdhD protein
LTYDGGRTQLDVEIPVEAPVQIVYGNVPFAVMMATPSDLEDFALGFSFTEGIVESRDEVRSVALAPQDDGWRVTLDLAPAAMSRHLARRRNLTGRTSCGVCGVENPEDLKVAARILEGTPPTPDAIRAALEALDARQAMNRAMRVAHAAAWCDSAGEIVLIREDVGRHNALDKLIGAALSAGIDQRQGFVLVTSRLSFEMVEKTARFGAPALVAVSAPTSLALDRARALGLAVFALARPDSVLSFSVEPAPAGALAS